MKKLLLFVLLLSTASASAQNITTAGRVADAENVPLAGVVVLQVGTSNAVLTDAQGAYSIVSPAGANISFTQLGYVAQQHAATASVLDVVMQQDAQLVDELVVIGYGVQRKSDVTGAISSVKAEDMENRSITRAEQALQGKTAGVQIITTSGSPGTAPDVRIRGLGSNSSSKPLFVVDGLRVSDIGGLDPNSIQSMEVLKDAASAAIYGAEAGNGVILITTKRGSAGFSKITYDFQYTVQSLKKTPRLLDAGEYIDYMTEGNYLTKEFIDANYDGVTDTNWADVAFENSMMQRHTLQFQGGNDRGSYFLSLAYLDNDGIIRGDRDTYKRLTATVNADYKIKPWFKVGTTNNFEKWAQRSVTTTGEYGGLLTGVMSMDPLTPDTYSPDRLPAFMQTLIDGGNTLLRNEAGDYYGVSQFFVGENIHPMIMRDRDTSSNTNFSVNGTIFGDFTPIKNLVVTSRLGYRLAATGSNSFSKPYYGSSQMNNSSISAAAALSNSIYYMWENFANYTVSRGRHTVNAMAGFSFADTYFMDLSGSVNGVKKPLDPNFWYISAQTNDAVKTIAGGTPNNARTQSWFGRLSYNFADKYIVQASLRADAADLSKLSSVQRWGYFPSVSAGWVISNEEFFDRGEGNPMTYAKLRASWGQNGSTAALGAYSWLASIASDTSYIFDPSSPVYSTGSGPSGLGNRNLKWETHEQIDFGIDTRFFNDRLSFSADYYKKKTKDLIVTGATLSLTAGNTTPPLNAGNIENSGFEFELGWRDRAGDFSYGVNANLATLKNKVTYIHPSITRINGGSYHTYQGLSAFEVGYPAWYFRGYEFTGIDDATGEPTFVTANENGIPSDTDKRMVGNPMPDFTYGLTVNLAWKGLDFTMFGTGSQGNDVWMLLARADRATGNKIHYMYEDRWTASNTGGSKPRAGFASQEPYLISDAMIFDGSYFKIKQLQLGYTLPSRWTKRAYVENLRLYVSLEDFFTFTGYPGFDPEVSTGAGNTLGFDKGNYPISKKVLFGLNLTF